MRHCCIKELSSALIILEAAEWRKGGGSVAGGGGARVNPRGAAVVALISLIHGSGARSRAVPETPFLTLNTHT